MSNMLSITARAPFGLNQSYPDGTSDHVQHTRRAAFMDAQGALVVVPVLSANALRARLRRAVAAEVERALSTAYPTAALSWQVAALISAGGAFMKDWKAPRATLDALVDFLPVTLFGGQWFTDQLPGRLLASDLMPATVATPPSLFGLSDLRANGEPLPLAHVPDGTSLEAHLVRTVSLTKALDDALALDDHTVPRDARYVMDPNTLRALAAETGEKKPGDEPADAALREQNLFAYETAIGGLWWFAGFSVLPGRTPAQTRQLQSLLRWALERVFLADEPVVLGGHHNTGLGLLQAAELQCPAAWPAASLWQTEWLAGVLDELPRLMGPESPWLQDITETKAKKARDASKARAATRAAEKAAKAAAAQAAAGSPDAHTEARS